ncbi:MAG: bacterioferritin [candidate division KSB1 bacterium]|nr:bacterioferritin [candidate division KSB1 bacterium]MDZ7357837.1 bacterioferritin [candidate division KSB1 bacterium]MDZ7377484.1 bacterioferritin [candidate division KSB1 bacterium]MDZ7398703.1 bacterioferritin [candidate division KSB1 bacterium]
MKGNPKVIEALNKALADELTAINQYMVHSEMCDNWGYKILHEKIEKRAITEMKHAERLIGRILFLEGIPIVSTLNPIHIGKTVPEQFQKDLASELDAIKNYQEYIKVCHEVGDAGTREVFVDLLQDEEGHADEIEAQLDQISQMGAENYLALQIGN